MRATSGPSRRLVAVVVVLAVVVAALASGIFFGSTKLVHKSSVAALARDHHPDAAASTTVAAKVHDVLFIGASYTAGLGATPYTNGYAYVIGNQPGWRTQVYGVPGTGFLNAGPHGDQTFAERLARLPTRPRPDLVVFQCGRNDVGFPSARLRMAVIDATELARRRFAGAQVVLVGPIPAHLPVPPGQLAVEATLRAAAATTKAIFIDPIAGHWITPQNQFGFVGHVPAHPDNRGYAYLAARLTAELDAIFGRHSTA